MSRVSFATRDNLDLLEEFYRRWQADPASVDATWQAFFEGFELASRRAPATTTAGQAQTGVVRLIYAYRDLGHLIAHLDPLSEPRPSIPMLELSAFGLREAQLDQSFDVSFFAGLAAKATLRELIAALRETYCRTIGVEYMHIQDHAARHWLRDRMEPRRNRPDLSRRQKLRVLMELHFAELFEKFLQTRFVGQKRFSLEGSETLLPVLDALVEKGPEVGVQEYVIGMAHRGRLNVLANILGKPYQDVFAEFEDIQPETTDGDGDVKYHLGFSGDRTTALGQPIHLSLTPNPSHLEAVDSVVEGRVRAKQFLFNDTERRRGVPLLIHGDAAFAGQGQVAETLNLSELPGYRTGGTIHVIVNNQIGFTTSPSDARSTHYCTDVAKMIQAPIFHVNGEDPEACVYVAELALAYRQEFRRDVVIDMYCYRRHGHNEGDEPSFTQPLMYQRIKDRPSVSALYTEQLLKEGALKPEEARALDAEFQARLAEAHQEIKVAPPKYRGMPGFTGRWQGLDGDYSFAPVPTGVPLETLRQVIDGLTRVPDGFHPHPKIVHFLEKRRSEFVEHGHVDWSTAEALAFGTLLLEKTPVRLSGQDSRRGTFSQRHAALIDVQTGQSYYPLSHLAPGQAPFAAFDSLLSEQAVLGFEFGFALDAPGVLVLWEAQFGDFANGAQVAIDQFLVCSESKWQRSSGVVLLLPHGYEGQGPEHSSARLERFLQLCAEDNIQVCNCTTPAQYFHVLRRQLHRPFRKPLIVLTPKSLLRLKEAVSPVDELATGHFQEVIDDAPADPERVRRVVLCSGKVFYDLHEKQAELKAADVAVVRVEQLYPFPEGPLRQVLQRYRRAKQWAWAQEESQNMGAWSFVEPRLRSMGYAVEYVGRDPSASPATGSHRVHVREQKELVEAALTLATPLPYQVRASAPQRLVTGRDLETDKKAPAMSG